MEKTERISLGSWLKRFWQGWGVSILVAVLIAVTFRSAIADWNDVPTGSMKPTILIGDRIYVNKLAYGLRFPLTTHYLMRWQTPQRGDIVVFFSPRDGTRLVKRVVGLPGDRIALRHNRLYINDRAVKYTHLPQEVKDRLTQNEQSGHRFYKEILPNRPHSVMITPDEYSPSSFGPITVPEGQFFMMGDNRDNSADSRIFGPVPISKIVGRSTAVVFSLQHHRNYLPRMDRFFTQIY